MRHQKDSAGSIGFINGRSSVFCQSCNRLRLRSDGKIRSCLYSVHDYDLRGLIRNGAGDAELRSMIEKIISEKGNFTKLNSPGTGFSMRKVGG